MRHLRCAQAALLAGWLGLLLPTWAWAQPAQAAPQASAPLPAEAFFGPEETETAILSPSGRYVAVLRGREPKTNVLFVIDTQNPAAPQFVAGNTGAAIRDVEWVTDDHLVMGMEVRDPSGIERAIYPGLYTVPRTGGRLSPLIWAGRGPSISFSSRDANNVLPFGWHRLGVPQDGSLDVIVAQLGQSRNDLTTLVPYRLNIETRELRSLDTQPLKNVNHWIFDQRGEPRVAEVFDDGHVRVYWRAPGQTDWQLLQDVPRLKQAWAPYAADSAGGLYVTHTQGLEGTRVVSRFDFDRQQPAAQPLVAVQGFDFRGQLITDPASGRLLGVRAWTDDLTTHWLTPGMKEFQARVDKLLPTTSNRIACRRCDSPDRIALVWSWSDQDPGSYYLWQPGAQRLARLGRSRPAIPPDRMARLAFVRTEARDGHPLPLWLTLPAREAGAAPPPVVVLVHGGPAVRGSFWAWHALPQFLASRGYAVLEPEFRGSDGYGQAHLQAGFRQWGQAMQDDVADALQWAVSQGHVDGGRACIMGASYGGYATLMGLARHPGLYRCGIAAMAVTDLDRFVQGSWWWRDDITSESRDYELRTMVGDAKADAAMLRQNSPVHRAADIQAPVLLVHGAKDRRVPVVHAHDMRAALREAGRDPEWLLMEDEGHGWHHTANQVLYAQRVEAFLARHLAMRKAAGTGTP